MLSELAEKTLPLPVRSSLLAYCPSMDLVAAALQDDQVQVFRLNGQKVFGVTRRKDRGSITALCWKPNGRTLAVAYSTNTVLLVSAHSGKIILQTTYASHSPKPICSLSWGTTFLSARKTHSLLEKDGPENGVSRGDDRAAESLLDDALSKGIRELDIEMPLDLPSELANLEVEASLPKLSTLPAGGRDDDIFSSRTSVDALFHTSNKETNESADVLMAGFEDGAAHLSVYDSFEVGSFTNLVEGTVQIVRHSSHPYVSTQALLLADRAYKPRTLSLLPIDLKFIPDTGQYLPLLASKSTQLQYLIRYMKQTVTQIGLDYRTSQELPQKFMRNVNEDLEEKEHDNLLNAALHLAATGNCSPVFKEWLIDQLGERGYKRWEKAATSGYEGVVRYTLQNLLPSLDRFAVILSRFRGLSRFFDENTAYGLETPELDRVFDTLSCIRLLAHTVLKIAGKELFNFNAFAKWLKLEIEVQGTDQTSSSVEEFPTSYAALDYGSIVDFIQGAMCSSELENLCGDGFEDDGPQEWVNDRSERIYTKFKETIATRGAKASVPSLDSLVSRLEVLTGDMFRGIAQAQKRLVRFGSCIDISQGEVGSFDVKVLFEGFSNSAVTCAVFVATTPSGGSKITMHKITLETTNGMSSTRQSEVAEMLLPSSLRVADLKFADDRTLIAALVPVKEEEGGSLLAYLPYREQDEECSLEYKPTGVKARDPTTLDLSQGDSLERFIRHRFEEQPPWTPGFLEVNGRKYRRVMCVMEKDGLRYKVFDLDSSGDAQEDEDADEEMEVE